MRRLFHYTTVSNLLKILESKEIRVATLYVPKDERPVVWCSFRQDWEPTATPGLPGCDRRVSFEELTRLETPARIEILPETAPLDWRAWRKSSGVRSRMVKALEEGSLRANSDVRDWRMSFNAIPEKDWLAIELFVNGQWQSSAEITRISPRLRDAMEAMRKNATAEKEEGL